jgi:hypothetical protein
MWGTGARSSSVPFDAVEEKPICDWKLPILDIFSAQIVRIIDVERQLFAA